MCGSSAQRSTISSVACERLGARHRDGGLLVFERLRDYEPRFWRAATWGVLFTSEPERSMATAEIARMSHKAGTRPGRRAP
jgi:hypothetical protein